MKREKEVKEELQTENLLSLMKELGIYTGINIGLSWILEEIYHRRAEGREISIDEIIRLIKRQKRVNKELKSYTMERIEWRKIARGKK